MKFGRVAALLFGAARVSQHAAVYCRIDASYAPNESTLDVRGDSSQHARMSLQYGFLLLLASLPGPIDAAVALYDVEVVHAYPHDTGAFTEGLFFLDGFLYESTGLEGHSSIRKVRLETGKVLQQVEIPAQYFGEGIVNWQNRIISLTWRSQIGFVFDLSTLHLQRSFSYEGEGWALTQDGRQLIMSDGSPELRFLNPTTLKETRRLEVTLNGQPVANVNELEWVAGEIFANVWHTDFILRIDPRSGAVVGVINLAGLLDPSQRIAGPDGVLNGIAYDAKGGRLFVTGKNWPSVFEVSVKPHLSGEVPRHN